MIARKLCYTHYKKHYRKGTLPAVPLRRDPTERNPTLQLTLPHAMSVAIQAEVKKRKMKKPQQLIRRMLAFAWKRLAEVG